MTASLARSGATFRRSCRRRGNATPLRATTNMMTSGNRNFEEPTSMSEQRFKEGVASILDELEQLYSQDKVGAIQINIALRDGGVRTLKAYDNGFRVLLVAAAAIGQREAFEATEVTIEESWRAPGD